MDNNFAGLINSDKFQLQYIGNTPISGDVATLITRIQNPTPNVLLITRADESQFTIYVPCPVPVPGPPGPPGPAPTVSAYFAEDTFTGANTLTLATDSPEFGGPWLRYAALAINGWDSGFDDVLTQVKLDGAGYAYLAAPTGGNLGAFTNKLTDDPGDSNYVVEYTFKVVDHGSNQESNVIIYGRVGGDTMLATSNFRIEANILYSSGQPTFDLGFALKGTSNVGALVGSLFPSGTTEALAVNTDHTLKLYMIDTNVTMVLNGTAYDQLLDSDITDPGKVVLSQEIVTVGNPQSILMSRFAAGTF